MPVLPPSMKGIARVAQGVRDQATRAKAQATKALQDQVAPALQHRTSIYTYFTVPDGRTHLLYSAGEWTQIKLVLENAGPVAIGTSADLGAPLSGIGITLETDDEMTFSLPRGDRLYITSGTLNRVKFIAQPIPWLQQITMAIAAVATKMR